MTARIETLLFALALLAALIFSALLLQRFDHGIQIGDHVGRLGASSQRLLRRLEAPLRITSYAPDNALLRKRIREVLVPWLRASERLSLRFVNPDAEPRRAREAGIRAHGELVLEYRGRIAHLIDLDEAHIGRAIAGLLRGEPRWLTVLGGHGERRFDAGAGNGLSQVTQRLKQAGYLVAALDASRLAAIPDNTSVLILADPDQPLDAHAESLVRRHLARGGNLLALDDRHAGAHPLGFVTRLLGLKPVPGWLYDPEPPMKMPAATLLAVEADPAQSAASDLELPLLLAEAGAFRPTNDAHGWRREPLLRPNPKAWAESAAPDTAAPSFDLLAGDTPGPLTAGWALRRQHDDREQRAIVIGDADFATNRFVGNGDNAPFVLSAIRWLAHDDWIGDFQPRVQGLQLSETRMLAIGFGFLFGLPLLLLGTGLAIHWRRRRG